MKFNLVFLVLLFSTYDAAISYDSSVNYISNPDFSIPKLAIGQIVILTSAGVWSEINNQIEIGEAKLANSRWGPGQFCDLVSHIPSNIYQSINLDAGNYQLNITWAACQWVNFANSQWSIYWNDVLVQYFTPINHEIHKQTLVVIANQGINKISLRAENVSQNQLSGAGMKLVQLYAQNYIRNGNFENPSTRKGWRILKSAASWFSYTNYIKIGQGTIFNPVWKTGQIVQLDADQNSQIYQYVQISAGKYHLKFDWAARTNVPYQSNQFSVWWNNVRLALIRPPDYQIHTFTTDVQASQGNNTFSLRGEGISDGYGVGIDNVKLWREF